MKKASQFYTSRLAPGLLKAAVFGANDGIITTFAVVAGVAGAGLAPRIVLIMGVANLFADGISMGVGDYLGERSEADLLKREGRKYLRHSIWLTGLITFIAFVIAGSLPLLPYLIALLGITFVAADQLLISCLATALALFLVGSLRTIITGGQWWRKGLETLIIGAIAATAAYFVGRMLEKLIT